MNPEHVWQSANDWPPDQRGDIRGREGWEAMEQWFRASKITPDDTNDGHTVVDQLKWLEDIRSGKWLPRQKKKLG